METLTNSTPHVANFNRVDTPRRSQPGETKSGRGRMAWRAARQRLRRKDSEATRSARDLASCSGGPMAITGGMAPRLVRDQPADDPRTEPDNSHPPGLATTIRM